MGRVIVIEFVSLDGDIEDPDGSLGTPWGHRRARRPCGPASGAGRRFCGRSAGLFALLLPSRCGGVAEKQTQPLW